MPTSRSASREPGWDKISHGSVVGQALQHGFVVNHDKNNHQSWRNQRHCAVSNGNTNGSNNRSFSEGPALFRESSASRPSSGVNIQQRGTAQNWFKHDYQHTNIDWGRYERFSPRWWRDAGSRNPATIPTHTEFEGPGSESNLNNNSISNNSNNCFKFEPPTRGSPIDIDYMRQQKTTYGRGFNNNMGKPPSGLRSRTVPQNQIQNQTQRIENNELAMGIPSNFKKSSDESQTSRESDKINIVVNERDASDIIATESQELNLNLKLPQSSSNQIQKSQEYYPGKKRDTVTLPISPHSQIRHTGDNAFSNHLEEAGLKSVSSNNTKISAQILNNTSNLKSQGDITTTTQSTNASSNVLNGRGSGSTTISNFNNSNITPSTATVTNTVSTRPGSRPSFSIRNGSLGPTTTHNIRAQSPTYRNSNNWMQNSAPEEILASAVISRNSLKSESMSRQSGSQHSNLKMPQGEGDDFKGKKMVSTSCKNITMSSNFIGGNDDGRGRRSLFSEDTHSKLKDHAVLQDKMARLSQGKPANPSKTQTKSQHLMTMCTPLFSQAVDHEYGSDLKSSAQFIYGKHVYHSESGKRRKEQCLSHCSPRHVGRSVPDGAVDSGENMNQNQNSNRRISHRWNRTSLSTINNKSVAQKQNVAKMHQTNSVSAGAPTMQLTNNNNNATSVTKSEISTVANGKVEQLLTYTTRHPDSHETPAWPIPFGRSVRDHRDINGTGYPISLYNGNRKVGECNPIKGAKMDKNQGLGRNSFNLKKYGPDVPAERLV